MYDSKPMHAIIALGMTRAPLVEASWEKRFDRGRVGPTTGVMGLCAAASIAMLVAQSAVLLPRPESHGVCQPLAVLYRD
jgi:hypothetical protein